MKSLLFSILFGCTFFMACNTATTETADATTDTVTEAATEAEEPTAGGDPNQTVFGAEFTANQPLTYDALLVTMSQTDSVQVQLQGTVEEVCQMKGCWMTIKPTSEGHDPVFVKFLDYEFFMPLNLAGGEVIMDGWAFREITPVDELRHYAEDAGKSEEEIAAITEPEEELKFMASGVQILKPGTEETN